MREFHHLDLLPQIGIPKQDCYFLGLNDHIDNQWRWIVNLDHFVQLDIQLQYFVHFVQLAQIQNPPLQTGILVWIAPICNQPRPIGYLAMCAPIDNQPPQIVYFVIFHRRYHPLQLIEFPDTIVLH